jgi:hypothetical protein
VLWLLFSLNKSKRELFWRQIKFSFKDGVIMKLIQKTPLELVIEAFPEIVMAVVTQTATHEEFDTFEQELKGKQEKRLKKCEYIDGSYRCENCGSSINENGETRFLWLHEKTRTPTKTSLFITDIIYCEGCEEAPPMYSSVGILRKKKQTRRPK